jgi:two-component system phosphate regulon sensor histidine kinase PhoR
VLAGELRVPAALAAAAVVLAAAAVASLVWSRDLALILDALHRANGSGERRPGGRPWLPAAARAEREARLLSRALAARAAEVERLLRAEAGIVERLPDPLLVLGADRAVRRANAAARDLFGADIAAVLRHPELRAAVDGALEEGGAVRSVAVRLGGGAAGSSVPREVQATVIPLDPPLAGGGRVIAVLSDRTRERAVERMRADFVANASHELRTPLASLIGFVETLRGPARDDPPARERFLAIMAEQGARMNRLIDDLLHLSRIEVVEHRPPEGAVALAPLLRRIAAGFEPRVAARGMRLLVDLPGGLPLISGDEDQLEQVAQNLLDNAVKYGRDRGTVRLAALPCAPGTAPWPPRPGVVVSVQDDGAGIPREHLPRLTERFYRVDKGRSRAVGGTGLGLAIVKHVVNRHRGQLAIESEEGKGSTFRVWLPVR